MTAFGISISICVVPGTYRTIALVLPVTSSSTRALAVLSVTNVRLRISTGLDAGGKACAALPSPILAFSAAAASLITTFGGGPTFLGVPPVATAAPATDLSVITVTPFGEWVLPLSGDAAATCVTTESGSSGTVSGVGSPARQEPGQEAVTGSVRSGFEMRPGYKDS